MVTNLFHMPFIYPAILFKERLETEEDFISPGERSFELIPGEIFEISCSRVTVSPRKNFLKFDIEIKNYGPTGSVIFKKYHDYLSYYELELWGDFEKCVTGQEAEEVFSLYQTQMSNQYDQNQRETHLVIWNCTFTNGKIESLSYLNPRDIDLAGCILTQYVRDFYNEVSDFSYKSITESKIDEFCKAYDLDQKSIFLYSKPEQNLDNLEFKLDYFTKNPKKQEIIRLLAQGLESKEIIKIFPGLFCDQDSLNTFYYKIKQKSKEIFGDEVTEKNLPPRIQKTHKLMRFD